MTGGPGTGATPPAEGSTSGQGEGATDDQGVTTPPANPAEGSTGHTEPPTAPANDQGTGEGDPGTGDPADGEPGDQGAGDGEPADGEPGGQGPDALRTARREAARHRREKQEALARATAAETALEASRKAYAESLLRDGELHQRSDLWFGGRTVDEVLDQNGAVVLHKVLELANDQVAARPGLGNGAERRPQAGTYGALTGHNAHRRQPGGSARTSDQWEAYEEENGGIDNWYDAGQSSHAGDLRNASTINRVTRKHRE